MTPNNGQPVMDLNKLPASLLRKMALEIKTNKAKAEQQKKPTA